VIIMNRLGIIGPRDSVEIILRICRKENLFNPLPLPYENLEDCVKLVEENNHCVDFWFFSGPAPYSTAMNAKVISEENSIFSPLIGSGLMITLFQAFQDQKTINGISFDTFLHSEVEETLVDLNLDDVDIYTFGHQGYWDTEKIVAFHMEKSKEKQVSIALTCFSNVYEALKAKQVPVYRVISPLSVIRKTLYDIEQKIKTKRYQLSSIAILAIEVDYSNKYKENPFSYDLKKKQNQLEYALLDFSEKVNGFLNQSTDSLFLLFTTKGELSKFLLNQSAYDFLNNLKLMFDMIVNVGIGYGLNVHLAEINVQKALKHAKHFSSPTVFEVHEDGSLHGPLQLNTSTDIPISSEYVWKEKLKGTKMSISTINKIESFSKQYGITEVTSNVLAEWLKVSERNARRILNDMEQIGLAQHIEFQQPMERGRPRKVYKIF
jgi:hypothetical protein